MLYRWRGEIWRGESTLSSAGMRAPKMENKF